MVPFTEFKTGGDVAHLATSQASPAGSPQKPHRRTTGYPEWDEMTGNLPAPGQDASANHRENGNRNFGFATMASMVTSAMTLHHRVALKHKEGRNGGAAVTPILRQGNNASAEARAASPTVPTTMQQLRLTKQRFASPLSKSGPGSLTGITSLSSRMSTPSGSMNRGGDMMQNSWSAHSLAPVMTRDKMYVDGPRSEPKSRHSKFRPMDRKVCGWLRKRNSKRFFGRSVWRNRWFVLDQRLRVLEYFQDHRMDEFLNGASSSSGKRGQDADSAAGADGHVERTEPCRAHIDMTRHTIHDNGTLEWELRPVPRAEDSNGAFRSGEKGARATVKSKKYGRVWVFRADDQDHKRMWIASMRLCSKDGIDDWIERSQGSTKKKHSR